MFFANPILFIDVEDCYQTIRKGRYHKNVYICRVEVTSVDEVITSSHNCVEVATSTITFDEVTTSTKNFVEVIFVT
jgi:uncharacterized protein YqfB (UPF0267 family)